MSSPELPTSLIVDTKTKTVAVTPKIETALPGIAQAFNKVDQVFLNNPEKYLKDLESSMFKFKSSEGSEVTCSLLHESGGKLDEVLVIFAPFSDREPKSSAKTLHSYITAETPGGLINKEKVAPNSWNQTTKSAVIFEVLGALGKHVPVLTIYGPVPTHAYSYEERGKFRKGNFAPAGRLAKEALREAQSRIHGLSSETQINGLHLSGASLGATNAIAAGNVLYGDFDVRTVTAQELIMGPEKFRALAGRFTFGGIVGEPSSEVVSKANPKISEPALRQQIDKYGSEPLGMNARMIKGMKPTYMQGLTKPEATVRAIERLLDNNIDLLVALAKNSGLTYRTANYLPRAGEHVVGIKAERGQKIGHLADEFVALSALIVALNILKKNKK